MYDFDSVRTRKSTVLNDRWEHETILVCRFPRTDRIPELVVVCVAQKNRNDQFRHPVCTNAAPFWFLLVYNGLFVLTLSFHRETVLDALLNDRQEFGNTERAIVCGVSRRKIRFRNWSSFGPRTNPALFWFLLVYNGLLMLTLSFL